MLWSPNLQLHYPFENQANDYSGNARHGTLGGAPPCTYATRPNAGRCLYFPGTGYVSTPSFGLSGTVVWFAADVRCKLSAAVNQGFIGENVFSNTVGYLLCFRPANTNSLSWKYVDGTSQPLVTATNYFLGSYNDAWLHLAVACDYEGKKTYCYRDGVLFYTSGTMSGVPAFPSAARAKYIGCYYPPTPAYPLTDGYLCGVHLGTLATMPPLAQMLANVNRLMLGMHPIW